MKTFKNFIEENGSFDDPPHKFVAEKPADKDAREAARDITAAYDIATAEGAGEIWKIENALDSIAEDLREMEHSHCKILADRANSIPGEGFGKLLEDVVGNIGDAQLVAQKTQYVLFTALKQADTRADEV